MAENVLMTQAKKRRPRSQMRLDLEHFFDMYWTMLRVQLAIKMQYRLDIVMWLIGFVFEPVIYLVVWTTVARAQGGSISGYTPADFAAYYLTFMVVRQLTTAPGPHNIAYAIRVGDMNALLLRPVHPAHNDFAEGSCHKLISFPPLLVIILLLLTLFEVNLHPPLWTIPVFLLALALAWLLRFIFQWTFGLIAFWTTQIEGLWSAYVTMQTMLGGFLAPVALLPAPMQTLASLLPFRWIFGFPVEVLLGRLSQTEVAFGLGIQLLWVLGSYAALRLFWGIAVRHYGAVGG
jgi:ABC-2 type transport system permease protein